MGDEGWGAYKEFWGVSKDRLFYHGRRLARLQLAAELSFSHPTKILKNPLFLAYTILLFIKLHFIIMYIIVCYCFSTLCT